MIGLWLSASMQGAVAISRLANPNTATSMAPFGSDDEQDIAFCKYQERRLHLNSRHFETKRAYADFGHMDWHIHMHAIAIQTLTPKRPMKIPGQRSPLWECT